MSFINKAYLEFLGSNKSELFCLESNFERNSNYGQLEEERVGVSE